MMEDNMARHILQKTQKGKKGELWTKKKISQKDCATSDKERLVMFMYYDVLSSPLRYWPAWLWGRKILSEYYGERARKKLDRYLDAQRNNQSVRKCS